jgi:glyoxylase-like metal-dependent hydrolase (beta-lactamase superfamily II)
LIRTEQHGDVTLAYLSTRRSRVVGYGVNVFLVGGALIDTGFHAARGDIAALLDAWRPTGVILTHQHEDHAGNIEMLAQSGIPLQVASATLDAVRAPERIGIYRRFVWSPMPPLATRITSWKHDELEMVFTPGHSSDHHAVWSPTRRMLFAGDLYLGRKVRVARPGENPRALVKSLRRAATLQPRVMLDSHRGLVPEPVSALLEKADWMEATIGEMDRRFAAGQPDAVVRDEVLGAETPTYYFSRGDLSKLNFVRAVRHSSSS